jgi:branched-chain amino acid aminotransferase
MAEQKVWIDGTLYNRSEAKISVFDHGLLYGDGVFEGIRVYNGAIFLCEEHVDRLFEGAHVLCLEVPLTKEEIVAAMMETVRANGVTDGYIRLIVTRGEGDLGLSPRKCPRPSVIVIAASIKLYPEEMYRDGLSIVTVPTPAVHPEALNPRIKSLNYLNNILAKIEALNAGVEEAIMLNHLGEVAECTGDNVFIVRRGRLLTPPPWMSMLEGCTRNAVMEIGRRMGLEVAEQPLQRYDLYTATECFLTGTAAELIPVVRIDGRTIGDGTPGPVTKELLGRFRDYIDEATKR